MDFENEHLSIIEQYETSALEIKRILFTSMYKLNGKHYSLLAVQSISILYSYWEGYVQVFPEHWERYTYPNANLKEMLNIFLRYRNGVAHGGDISSEKKVTQEVYAKYRTLVNDLMYALHDKFMDGIQNQTFMKAQ